MAVNNVYNEESIVTLSPRESVRQNSGMYIGSIDTKGMHQLLTEILSNAIDEAAAGYGDQITVAIETKTNRATVEDKGRGIPFRMNSSGKYALVEMCTSLHSGGKFKDAGNYKSALGLHGVGATVTNALSSSFLIESRRDDGRAILKFEGGIKTEFNIEDGNFTSTRGSTVSFIPDVEIFGKATWDIQDILQSLQMHSILNNGLRFQLAVDGEMIKEFYYTDGLRDFLSLQVGELKPVTTLIQHKVKVNPNTAEEVEVELAMQYVNDGKERTYAFTNGGYNPDFGTHVTGFRSAFTSLLNSKAKEYGLLETGDDNLEGGLLRKGMFVALSIRMTERPQFSSQTKEKLTTPSARAAVSQAIGTLTLLRADAEAIVKKALIEKKSDESAQRKRDAEQRISKGGKNLNALKDLPEKFADCINKRGDRELFLTEGLSASGSAKMGRDVYTQAIYPLRGKPLNTWNKELPDIIKNQEIKDILLILGCGVGESFNIKNMRYNKVIILADADIDGAHINCLLMGLFTYHLPELVKAGYVYYATPPLFKVTKGASHKYLYSPEELKDYRGWDVMRFKGLGEQQPEELWESTLDPSTRVLIQAQPTDFDSTSALLNTIIGSRPGGKREFILAHAKDYAMTNDGETAYDIEGDE